MSDWAAKRFWKAVDVTETPGGFSVALDGRLVRTPAKSSLVLPSRALAEAVAVEWDAQDDKIQPLTMPNTRSANAAIDKVVPQRAEVVQMLADYGDSDLICYRADAPEGLVARQSQAWDPLMGFARETLGAPLDARAGVIHVPQDPVSLAALHHHTDQLTPFELTAFHDLVSLSGSLVIGFATIRDFDTVEALWQASRIDEAWQIEQWGDDEDATEQAEIKRAAFRHAAAFFRLVRPA